MTRSSKIIVLVTCFCFGTFTVFALFLLSHNNNHRNNDFIRLFPPEAVKKSATIDIKYNSYYIAGVAKDNIYLGNITAPAHLLKINTSSADTQHINLDLERIKHFRLRALKIAVDSPFFYLTDGTSVPGLFRGKVSDWAANRFMFDSIYFTQSTAISNTSFALRVTSSLTKQYTLGKLESSTPHFTFKPSLLEKQVDGKFCVDGMLHYNKAMNQLLYLYHYRNQYLVMDTNLNLLYRGKTIDTISHAQIKVGSIKSANQTSMAAPPLMVNKQSCVSGSWLFINSKLQAKNEKEAKHQRSSVIDVYNLQNQTYEFSFYLSDREGKKVREFKVHNNFLIALFDHYVIRYDLNDKFFKYKDKSKNDGI